MISMTDEAQLRFLRNVAVYLKELLGTHHKSDKIWSIHRDPFLEVEGTTFGGKPFDMFMRLRDDACSDRTVRVQIDVVHPISGRSGKIFAIPKDQLSSEAISELAIYLIHSYKKCVDVE